MEATELNFWVHSENLHHFSNQKAVIVSQPASILRLAERCQWDLIWLRLVFFSSCSCSSSFILGKSDSFLFRTCIGLELELITDGTAIFPCSPHAIPDRLRIRVNRISLQDYEGLHYDKEKLREVCKFFFFKWGFYCLWINPVYSTFHSAIFCVWLIARRASFSFMLHRSQAIVKVAFKQSLQEINAGEYSCVFVPMSPFKTGHYFERYKKGFRHKCHWKLFGTFYTYFVLAEPGRFSSHQMWLAFIPFFFKSETHQPLHMNRGHTNECCI